MYNRKNYREHKPNSNLAMKLALAMAIFTLFVFLTSVDAAAFDLSGKNVVGARVGVWANSGESGSFLISSRSSQEVTPASAYAEIFIDHSFTDWFHSEVALGLSSRTDLVSDGLTIMGGVNLYPIQLSAKFYPLAIAGSGRFQPFIQGGAGLTIASQSSQRLNSFRGESRSATDINFMLGGGVDIPVASSIALSVAAKYHRIDFGEDEFLGVSDYSGFTITAGVGYTAPLGGK